MAGTRTDPLDPFFAKLKTTSERPALRRLPAHDLSAAVVSRRILVVDDNQDAADSLKLLLQSEGHKAVSTYDGESAVKLAQTLRPDFLLLDIGMPTLNGYEVARHIRAQPWGRTMRLIAITGWGPPHDRSHALDAGFDFHLLKPVRLDVLTNILAANGLYALGSQHPSVGR